MAKNIQNLQKENEKAAADFTKNQKEENKMKEDISKQWREMAAGEEKVSVMFLKDCSLNVLETTIDFKAGDVREMTLREDGDVQVILGDEVFFFNEEEVKIIERLDAKGNDVKAEDNTGEAKNTKEENKMTKTIKVENLEMLTTKEVMGLMKKDIEEINQETAPMAKQVLGNDRFVEILANYKPEEVKEKVEAKEYVETADYKVDLSEVEGLSIKQAMELGKLGFDFLTPENAEQVEEILGDKAKDVMPNPKKYIEYSKAGTPFCLVMKNARLKLGVVEWNNFSITNAEDADISKFNNLESMAGLEYVGKINGKSSQKVWEADFFIEDDGQVTFFNSKFNVGKEDIRASVKALRKAVRNLQAKLMKAEVEAEVNNAAVEVEKTEEKEVVNA